MEVVSGLGGEAWFQLGDRDLGLHLVRTQALRSGEPLSAVTGMLAKALGVEVKLLPATDDALRTWIDTPAGSFPFQEWFVARQHRDEVDRVRFDGEATATPAPGVLDAIDDAELIVIAPSNPFISIWPILAVAEIRAALERRARDRASRSARSSAAGRSRVPPTGCSSAWRAAPRLAASRRATRGSSTCSSSTGRTPTAPPRSKRQGRAASSPTPSCTTTRAAAHSPRRCLAAA